MGLKAWLVLTVSYLLDCVHSILAGCEFWVFNSPFFYCIKKPTLQTWFSRDFFLELGVKFFHLFFEFESHWKYVCKVVLLVGHVWWEEDNKLAWYSNKNTPPFQYFALIGAWQGTFTYILFHHLVVPKNVLLNTKNQSKWLHSKWIALSFQLQRISWLSCKTGLSFIFCNPLRFTPAVWKLYRELLG